MRDFVVVVVVAVVRCSSSIQWQFVSQLAASQLVREFGKKEYAYICVKECVVYIYVYVCVYIQLVNDDDNDNGDNDDGD